MHFIFSVGSWCDPYFNIYFFNNFKEKSEGDIIPIETENVVEPSIFKFAKNSGGANSQVFDISCDPSFGNLVASVTSGIAPTLHLSRLRQSELRPRTYFFTRTALSTFLSNLEKLDQLIEQLDYQTTIKLTDKNSVGLTLFSNFTYISLTYTTPRGNNYYFNLNLEEYTKLKTVLMRVREERDLKLDSLKKTMGEKHSNSPNQTTLFEITYTDDETGTRKVCNSFDLESGVKTITDAGKSVICTSKRRVEIPTLASIATLFTTILSKCEKEGNLNGPLDAMMISRHIELYFKKFVGTPFVNSDILASARYSLDSRHSVDAAFTDSGLINAILTEAGHVAPTVYIPESQNGYLNKWGISSAINIEY